MNLHQIIVALKLALLVSTAPTRGSVHGVENKVMDLTRREIDPHPDPALNLLVRRETSRSEEVQTSIDGAHEVAREFLKKQAPTAVAKLKRAAREHHPIVQRYKKALAGPEGDVVDRINRGVLREAVDRGRKSALSERMDLFNRYTGIYRDKGVYETLTPEELDTVKAEFDRLVPIPEVFVR